MTDLPLVSLLRTKMQWHQARQKVLAENVANANTPGFAPRDLQPVRDGSAAGGPGAPGAVGLARTSPVHLAASSTAPENGTTGAKRFETRPSGNAVHLEDEMLKIADNQSEYQLAASLYQKGLSLLRTAAGARGG